MEQSHRLPGAELGVLEDCDVPVLVIEVDDHERVRFGS
jgi:hypothetical protein